MPSASPLSLSSSLRSGDAMNKRKDKLLDALILAALMSWTLAIMFAAVVLSIMCLLSAVAGEYKAAFGSGVTAFVLMVAGFAIVNYQEK